MNHDFARIITLLRKEKKLSQKEAAKALGVSQSLLSHYEKGIRECGLDFVIKAARFYDVSTDYLLGITPRRFSELTEMRDEETRESAMSSTHTVNKRLIINSLNIIYDMMTRSGNRKLSVNVSNYFMLSVYKIFRTIYSANRKNPQDIFSVDESLYRGYSLATQEMIYADIAASTSTDNSERFIKSLENIEMSPVQLSREYPQAAGSLINVIQHAESKINTPS